MLPLLQEQGALPISTSWRVLCAGARLWGERMRHHARDSSQSLTRDAGLALEPLAAGVFLCVCISRRGAHEIQDLVIWNTDMTSSIALP